MKKGEIVLLILALLILLAGIFLFLLPSINQIRQKEQSEQAVLSFLQEHQPQATESPESDSLNPVGDETQPDAQPRYAELLAAMRAYNAEIYANGQAGLADPWAYTSEVFDLTEYGLSDEAVAVLAIPKMDLREPVYLGATADHLNRGIAQLSISSMPIGGENTNCVLAGHRGWDGALFFRHIEYLEAGDTVTLTNLWQTLTYRVCEIKIIQPYQAEEILIQPGRDLLTLITCHPYGSGGQYRYVVVCERTG